MIYQELINSATLNSHFGQENWVIMDCRFSLADSAAGYRAYVQSHLPGARYAHLDKDLSGPITPTTGRHPLPDPAHLRRRFSKWGIGNDTQVVTYDDMGGMLAAARLWWLLRWLGHQAVAVLDGGFPAWQKVGLPVTTELPTVRPAIFEARPDNQLWLTAAQVAALPPTDLLVDARGQPAIEERWNPSTRWPATFRGRSICPPRRIWPLTVVFSPLRNCERVLRPSWMDAHQRRSSISAVRAYRLPQYVGDGSRRFARLAALPWFLERMDQGFKPADQYWQR
jgi:rhodanese-related sulfurtransferase